MLGLSFPEPSDFLLVPPVDGTQPEAESYNLAFLSWRKVESGASGEYQIKVGSVQIYISFHVVMSSLKHDELYIKFTDNI